MGQLLRVPLLESKSVERKGKWKDGIFSCFRHGLLHPHLWIAWICPQILLGQILTRMKMTWLVKPAASKSSMQSLMGKIFILLVVYSFYDALLAPPLFEVTVGENGDVILRQNMNQRWHQVFYVLMSLPMTVYGVLVVVKLRAAIRAKYGIPTGKLGMFEDACCVCCCNCCIMSQLARQTADYDDAPAAWCSQSGMQRPSKASDEDSIIPAIPV
jgi:Cys-rich protein (TIGR01571 family)